MMMLILIAVLVLAACGDATGPELSATYRLVRLVGQPVPGAKVTLSGGEHVVVGGGVLELHSDGRYVDTLTVCTDDGCRHERSGGRYETGAGEVSFWPDGTDGGSAASVTDGVLVWNASVYVLIE